MARINNLIVFPLSTPTINDYVLGTKASTGRTVNYRITDLCSICHGNDENISPTAYDDIFSLVKNSTISGQVSLNDEFGNGNNYFEAVTTALNGTLEFNNDGSFTYTPNTDFVGFDQFSYSITDADNEKSIANVSISVQDVIIETNIEIFSFQFDSLTLNIDNIDLLTEEYINNNTIKYSEDDAKSGITYNFSTRGRFGFIITGVQENEISIIDVLNNDVTSTFDTSYDADNEIQYYVSREYITPSNIYYKIFKQ